MFSLFLEETAKHQQIKYIAMFVSTHSLILPYVLIFVDGFVSKNLGSVVVCQLSNLMV